jgi:hypothetical protein
MQSGSFTLDLMFGANRASLVARRISAVPHQEIAMVTRTARPARKTSRKAPSKARGSTKATKTSYKPPVTRPALPEGSKQARLIALLRSPSGGTIEQMSALTGWQPHTVRGTISGVLRKRLGLEVATEPGADGGSRIYRIAA